MTSNNPELTELIIKTDDGFGINGIFPRRTISVNGKSATTPAVAIPIDRIEEYSEVHSQCRMVNEVHITVNERKFSRELESDRGPISKEIESALENSKDDEVTIIFTTFNETNELESEDGESHKEPVRMNPDSAKCLVETISKYTDILPIPMFREIAYAVDEDAGRDDLYFEEYLKSVVTFLNHAETHAPDRSVMGVLSGRLPWACLKRLSEIYVAFEVKAFNFNLDRLKLTADDQVEKIDKVMEHVAELEMEDEALFYLMNPERGDFDSDIGAWPAADFAALGFGFDIIGSRRSRRRMNYDEITPNPESFYLFDRKEQVYRRLELRNLIHQFPEESAFEVEDVVRLCRESPNRIRYNLQALLNAEQLSLAAMDYRRQEAGEAAYQYLRAKSGFTPDISDSMVEVRQTFDDVVAKRDQTDLDDF